MTEGLPLTIWSWDQGDLSGTKISTSTNALPRHNINPRGLRILSTPLDLGNRVTYPITIDYLDRHGVPRGFLLERESGVNYSFGSAPSTRQANIEVAWMHLICKDVVAGSEDRGNKEKHSTRHSRRPGSIKEYSKWYHFSFVLIQHPDAGTTLLCFAPLPQIEQYFDYLLQDVRWKDSLHEPYTILAAIIEIIWIEMDAVAWRLADIFRDVERETLRSSKGIDDVVLAVDFVTLHNISKHAIYLNEAFEAAQSLVQSMRDQHLGQSRTTGTALHRSTDIQKQFQRHLRLFQTTQLRLTSLDKRISNITNLAFNVVTQQDSRIMKRDSASMNTIAIMTLVFLPSSLIASLFGSSFFNFDVASDGSGTVNLSSYFWIFWVVAVPCTVIIVGLWLKLRPARVPR